MTPDEPRPTFEVYPPAVEGTTSGPLPALTPRDPGPPEPDGPVGTQRRAVLRIGLGIVVGGVALTIVAQAAPAPTPDEDWDAQGTGYDEYPVIDIGGYTAQVPQGWEVRATSLAEAVVTNGANRLEAYAFNAAEGERAADIVAALSARRQGDFSGRLGAVSDTFDGSVQRATVKASGTLSGRPARLVGQLWIDADGQALLVVRVLTAASGSGIEEEARSMTQDLSGGFG